MAPKHAQFSAFPDFEQDWLPELTQLSLGPSRRYGGAERQQEFDTVAGELHQEFAHQVQEWTEKWCVTILPQVVLSASGAVLNVLDHKKKIEFFFIFSIFLIFFF